MATVRVDRWLLITLVVALAGAYGCGSDGGDQLGGRITKKQVIERGDELCRDLRRKVDALTSRAENKVNPSAQARALVRGEQNRVDLSAQADTVRAVVREREKFAAKFDELEGPDQDILDRYVRTVREQIVFARRVEKYYRRTPRVAELTSEKEQRAQRALLAASQSVQETANRLRELARRYGFKVCGSKNG